MSEKHLVCHGAICQCKFGTAPDTLTVKTQKKTYINDADGSRRLLATDKDIGSSTFEKNTFGPCKQQPLPGGGYKPCQAVVSQWSKPYDQNYPGRKSRQGTAGRQQSQLSDWRSGLYRNYPPRPKSQTRATASQRR
jgi:hypothetical protein